MSRSDPTGIRDWILVVEDDAALRVAMRLVLQDAGYGVETSATGRAALAAISTKQWDVVLLDLRLPGISGLDVLRAAKRLSPLTPVIMITGYGSKTSVVDAMNEGAFAYLEKPVDGEDLLRTVSRALNQRIADQNRQRLAAIVESSEDAIIGKTLDGTIVTWNAAAERLYGYAAHEVVGRSMSRLLPADRSDELERMLAYLRRGERIENY